MFDCSKMKSQPWVRVALILDLDWQGFVLVGLSWKKQKTKMIPILNCWSSIKKSRLISKLTCYTMMKYTFQMNFKSRSDPLNLRIVVVASSFKFSEIFKISLTWSHRVLQASSGLGNAFNELIQCYGPEEQPSRNHTVLEPLKRGCGSTLWLRCGSSGFRCARIAVRYGFGYGWFRRAPLHSSGPKG